MTMIFRQAILAAIGTFGFAILFHLPKNRMVYVILGSFCTSLIQQYVDSKLTQAFTGALLATLFAVWFAEGMARLLRTPATLLLTPLLIPLVPGGSLFYTMQGILSGDSEQMREYALTTVQVGFGIAFGSLAAMAVVHLIADSRKSKE